MSDLPAISSVQQGQLSWGFKQDHDGPRAVVSIHKSDRHACNLNRAVQGHNLEAPRRYLEPLVHQTRCDWRAIDDACTQPYALLQLLDIEPKVVLQSCFSCLQISRQR